MIILSIFLALLVVATCTAVIIIFFKRLHRIEEELWGEKQREAADTAASEYERQHEEESKNE